MQRPDRARAILPILHQVRIEEVLDTFPAMADRQFPVLDEASTTAHLVLDPTPKTFLLGCLIE